MLEKLKNRYKQAAMRALLFTVLSILFISMPVSEVSAQVNAQEAVEIAKDMLNTYLLQGVTATVSGKPIIESGLYRIDFNIGDSKQPVYLTQDGKFLMLPNSMIDIAAFKERARKQQEPEVIAKRDKPSVELYVMSLCPYGVSAEQEVLPLINTFGDKLDFAIRYIVDASGDTIDKVKSLHGPKEVVEDLRQAAIWRYYPDKFLAYLNKIQEKSCLISCGEISLDTYWKAAARKLGINTQKVESFVHSDEAMDLLKQNGADSEKYDANASPTLIINGVKSEAIYQGLEATKQTICSAFTVTPQQCQ